MPSSSGHCKTNRRVQQPNLPPKILRSQVPQARSKSHLGRLALFQQLPVLHTMPPLQLQHLLQNHKKLSSTWTLEQLHGHHRGHHRSYTPMNSIAGRPCRIVHVKFAPAHPLDPACLYVLCTPVQARISKCTQTLSKFQICPLSSQST